jgi:F-type H+-transporting ATPase subunit delta
MAKQPRTRIAEVIAERTLAGGDDTTLVQEVAAYLLDQDRTDELESILRDVMQYRADHGIVEVIAHTAHPLAPETKQAVERETRRIYPAAKQIIVSEQVDPTLVGGVRLEFANQQLDLSVRSKLNLFKQLTAA